MSTQNDELLDTFQAESKSFKHLNFPLTFTFKIGTIHNDFIATDNTGATIAFVRAKLFKLKEDVIVYTNESKSTEIYRIRADKWIDFNTTYTFTQASGEYMGSVGRKGMKSIWKASYSVFDPEKKEEYTIGEENPWAKVGDAVLGELPFVSFFTGYLFNPRYVIKNNEGEPVARLKKSASMFGRTFTLESLGNLPAEDGERLMLSLMMMVLLERRRG